nr:heavy metal-binding domain-containing protein [Campylobacter sp.]
MFDLTIFLILIAVGYIFGTYNEKRHFASIKAREKALFDLPTTTLETPLQNKNISQITLVSGSVVVSIDYFKRIYAGIINFFGGKVVPYESLLDRARREAVLRCKETARKNGVDELINLRIETSSITKNAQKVGCVEVFAYATAIYYEQI